MIFIIIHGGGHTIRLRIVGIRVLYIYMCVLTIKLVTILAGSRVHYTKRVNCYWKAVKYRRFRQIVKMYKKKTRVWKGVDGDSITGEYYPSNVHIHQYITVFHSELSEYYSYDLFSLLLHRYSQTAFFKNLRCQHNFQPSVIISTYIFPIFLRVYFKSVEPTLSTPPCCTYCLRFAPRIDLNILFSNAINLRSICLSVSHPYTNAGIITVVTQSVSRKSWTRNVRIARKTLCSVLLSSIAIVRNSIISII